MRWHKLQNSSFVLSLSACLSLSLLTWNGMICLFNFIERTFYDFFKEETKKKTILKKASRPFVDAFQRGIEQLHSLSEFIGDGLRCQGV